MTQAGKGSVLAACGLALTLTACSSVGPALESLPAGVGLPANAPPRPATAYEYPAVHDMPPPRSTPTMSEEQQDKVEKELTALRERQEPGERSNKKHAPATKKKAVGANNGHATGAKTNP
jgi:hypothetical protein